MNQLAFIKPLLYQLNRNYGVSATFYREGPQTVNNITGRVTVTRTKYWVRRLIRLPDRKTRTAQYSIPLVHSSRHFVLGGNYDISDREIIIETKRLPTGFIPAIGDNIVCDHVKYVIKSVTSLDLNLGYFLQVGSTDGDLATEIHNRNMADNIQLNDVVTK